MIEDICFQQNVGRRRVFWTTQHGACGSYVFCGADCSIPGLVYVDQDIPEVGWQVSRTISNTDWLQGLILNILNTRARTDSKCPAPQAIFGHWSESYRGDGLNIGSLLWNAASKPYIRISDAEKAIGAAVKADMGKLIAQDLADDVEVETNYRKQGRVDVVVTAIVKNTRHVVDLSGRLVSGSWVWH